MVHRLRGVRLNSIVGPSVRMRTSTCRLVYTVEEVADLLGFARSTMYERVRAGDIASVRLGRRLFITAPTVTALIGVQPPMPAELTQQRRAHESQGSEPAPTPSTDRC